jgi:hypothetical protein
LLEDKVSSLFERKDRNMSTETFIEQRLAAVEAAVAELQRRLAPPQPASNWLEQVIGSFKDRGSPGLRPDVPGSGSPRSGQWIVRYLLDTDHISILQKQAGPEFAALAP